MARVTRSISLNVPITTPVKLLEKNPYRVMYSIQNLGPTNFICVAQHQQVNANPAATADHNTGQVITAGQSVSDTDDKDEVWAVANTAACTVAVLEVVEPVEGERLQTPRLRPSRAQRAQLRHGTRQGP